MNTTGETPPKLNGPTLQYFSGSIYVVGGEVSSATDGSIRYFNDCYMLNLTTLEWSKIQVSQKYTSRYFTGSGISDSKLILLYGWSNSLNDDENSIFSLDLLNPTTWEQVAVDSTCFPIDSFSYATASNKLFMFGGYNQGEYLNSLIQYYNGSCTIISDNYVTPTARMYHSMVVINGNIYVFGGESVDGFLSDMWKFTESIGWESLKIIGDSPGSRSGHAYGADGDIMVIWGGLSTSGYINSMYTYGAISGTWSLINPTGVLPSPRAGSCLVVNLPLIYIYGGITNSGLVNELWEYSTATNKYTLLYDGGSNNAPYPSKYPICTDIDQKLIVMFGTGDSETPFESVHAYDFSTNSWQPLFTDEFSVLSRSLAINVYLGGDVLVMGGEAWSTDAYIDAYVLNLTTGARTYVASLPFYYYGGTFATINNNIYIYGGGSMIGNTMRISIPTPNLILVNLSDFSSLVPSICSAGSEGSDENCSLCPAGSYSESQGNAECDKCPAGTYNSISGANSERQCYPCVAGTFSSTIGATYCLQCPNGKYCPVGSTYYSGTPLEIMASSSQPSNYVVDTSISLQEIAIFAALPMWFLVFMIIYLLLPKLQNIVVKLDLFKTSHNYALIIPMVMTKTKCGGVFSLLFILAAILMISLSTIQYDQKNIEESKALIPLVILSQIEENISADLGVYLTLYSYGGECTSQCGEGGLFDITLNSISYKGFQVTCTVDGDNCIVYVFCTGCQLGTGATIEYNMQEKASYCSAIMLSINSTSSIPNEYSSVSESALPSENKVFRGFTPTEFYLMMTPSLFISQATEWSSPQTGFHISINENAAPGSEFNINE